MPNFEENQSTTVNPATTYDVSTTYDDTAKSTKSDAMKDENPLDKVTTDETKDENKKQEKNSLQREVSVDALSSKTFRQLKCSHVCEISLIFRVFFCEIL